MSAAAKLPRKPFFCGLGLHSWFIDRAMLTRAKQCRRCEVYKDEQAGRRLEFEREVRAWAATSFPSEAADELVRLNLRGWDVLQVMHSA